MVNYSISFIGDRCELSNINIGKGESFVVPEMPYNKDIKYLTIKDSSMPTLSEDTLRAFENLERLEAPNIGIEELSSNAFMECKHLKHINISNNRLKKIDSFAFNENRILTFIYLVNNQLEALPVELFFNLEHLFTLDLSGNKLNRISKKMFKDLKSLKFLNLSHNQLLKLNAKEIMEQTPRLKDIELRDNDFSYDALHEILKVFKAAGVTCSTSIGKMRSRNYKTQLYEGIEYIPEAEYERLISKKRISKLEQEVADMKFKMAMMQSHLGELMMESTAPLNDENPRELELRKKELNEYLEERALQEQQLKEQESKETQTTTSPFTVIRAEDLEKEFQDNAHSVKTDQVLVSERDVNHEKELERIRKYFSSLRQ